MPDAQEEQQLAELLAKLIADARQHPEMSRTLRQMAQLVLEMTEPEPEAVADEPQPAPREPLPQIELTLGWREEQAPKTLVYATDQAAPTDGAADSGQDASAAEAPVDSDRELRELHASFTLKAEATRWALERMDRTAGGADFSTEIKPRDKELIERSDSLPGCFLWMLGTFSPSPDTREAWECLAEAFANSGEVVNVCRQVLAQDIGQGEFLERTLEILAETQSALRAAVMDVGQGFDPDQVRLFRWLRGATQREQIFIPRFMRESDRADPGHWEALRGRIAELENSFAALREQERERRNLFGKVRYHAGRIKKAGAQADPGDWHSLATAIEQLVAEGVPSSNLDLRNALLPIVEEVPELDEDLPGFNQVLRDIDYFLSTSPVAAQRPAEQVDAPEVEQARKLLQGRELIVIGGEVRGNAREALREKLGLAEVHWLAGEHHQSVSMFKPYIERDSVVLVLLAIRWSSHGFGEVKSFCDQHHKPLVRLPGGYSPNQVARQILDQAGERLAAAVPN